MSLKKTSKFISLILRHKPEVIGITLDEHGWANVEELIKGVSKTHNLNMEILEQIVREDEKQRYSFNEDKTLIRANQGHSVPVDVELEELEPPRYLYHGTGEKYRDSIDKEGIKSKSRLYVHLSSDMDTAVKVGSRHGKPIVYRVWAERMYEEGIKFYKSANGVWLTKYVAPEYIKRETFDDDEINKVVNTINELLLQDESGDDTSRAESIFELSYDVTWEVLQQALFKILLDDNRKYDDYYQVASVVWNAILEDKRLKEEKKLGLKFKKKTTIGLLYYRLGRKDPYENLIWSITCYLYHLDYANSEYMPLKDERIIKKLEQYGIVLDEYMNYKHI